MANPKSTIIMAHVAGWLLFFCLPMAFLYSQNGVALSMAIQINKQLHLTQRKARQAETDKAEAELSFLKAQINPHFLFNTLNNIYVLALNAHPNTAESIMKLSNIMRYMTDDVRSEMVLLQEELDCIENFISLQKLRLGEKTPLSLKMLLNTVSVNKNHLQSISL